MRLIDEIAPSPGVNQAACISGPANRGNEFRKLKGMDQTGSAASRVRNMDFTDSFGDVVADRSDQTCNWRNSKQRRSFTNFLYGASFKISGPDIATFVEHVINGAPIR